MEHMACISWPRYARCHNCVKIRWLFKPPTLPLGFHSVEKTAPLFRLRVELLSYFPCTNPSLRGTHAKSSTPEAILAGMSRAWRKARRRTAVGEDPCRFKGGSRKNSFNNRGLITGTAGKVILPENFGVARWGDTGQEGRAVVTSRGGILDAVGVEGPEAADVDGGAAESVVGTVEVAHADLAGAFWVAAVAEHSEMKLISGITTAFKVTPTLLETGLRHCRRCPYRPRGSIPPFSP